MAAGIATTPQLQIGVAWEVPRQTMILSSLGPPLLDSPTAVCLPLPMEAPFLPIRGAVAFPL